MYIFGVESPCGKFQVFSHGLVLISYCKKRKAGSGWIHVFLTRHPELSLRKPEPTSIARATGFNRPQVNRFFQLLEDVLHQYHFDSSGIFTCDETGKCPDYNV